MRGSTFLGLVALVAATPAYAQDLPVLARGTHRLQQVALTTTDLDRAIVYYRDRLGLELLFVANNMAFFDLAGTRLMIALDLARPTARPQSILYFDAPDFNAAVGRLTALNIPLEGGVETVQTNATGSLKLQQFLDPDGNALAVMGFVPAG
jgi:catechol 2,3-dioxygenase-like lactoylglutathione lyase family enzyme